MNPVLNIDSLYVHFTKGGILKAVNGLCLEIYPGEIMALVGESGCGKSITALSVLRLLPPNCKIVSGKITFKNYQITEMPLKQMRALRGREIGLIQQDPASSLNPVLSVGYQITEAIQTHFSLSKKEAQKKAIEWMEKVQLPNPQRLYKAYPHELSGGMKQRVLIAIALACKPSLLLADEPTTALDVSIQKQVLSLLKQLVKEYNIALLLISHDLGIVAEIANRVAVMYAGKIVETAPVDKLFSSPGHPYTQGLLCAMPKILFSQGHQKSYNCLQGGVPNPRDLPNGCDFHPRCSFSDDFCKIEEPKKSSNGKVGAVWCHNASKVLANNNGD
jgi:peptide/nickel transport system ATP-binding protein